MWSEYYFFFAFDKMTNVAFLLILRTLYTHFTVNYYVQRLHNSKDYIEIAFAWKGKMLNPLQRFSMQLNF